MTPRNTLGSHDSATATYGNLASAAPRAPLSGWAIALLSLDVALITAGALLWLSR